MEAAPLLTSLIFLLLSRSYGVDCLCDVENGTMARCHGLDDVKHIDTHDLESLRTTVDGSVLRIDSLRNLSGLRHLDLSGGELRRIEPGSFHDFDRLKSLDLSDNSLDYLELGSLNGLHHLHSLNLRRNNLTQLPPALMRLKSLRHLDAQGNPFECNCATLRVRDVLTKRAVKLSKKVICTGPGNMKGTSLLKPDTEIICAFEEQDKEMQKDQPVEGSGELGSGDPFDDWPIEETEYEDAKESPVTVQVTFASPSEVETPAPEASSTIATPEASTNGTLDEESEIFFDGEEKNATKQEIKDALFYPAEEGSGDEEEGSGAEGSGTGIDFMKNEEVEDANEIYTASSSTTESEGIIDMIWGALWGTTAAPEETKEASLEDEEFIDASTQESGPAAPAEEVVPTIARQDLESVPEKTGNSDASASGTGDSSSSDDSKNEDKTKAAVMVEDNLEDMAEVSPAKQSKKGMGSYVVLAALLAILAGLIGFAAYKGDFCRKKRKRDDVESGTEMKDMQKALLDGGSSTQPKISSNGNAENVPLMGAGHRHEEDSKIPDVRRKNSNVTEAPKYTNGTATGENGDPAKPPRKMTTTAQEEVAKIHDSPVQSSTVPQVKSDDVRSADDPSPVLTNPVDPSGSANDLPDREDQRPNGPPLSPGAQRVKITLQENPDSVPKTPILITRTLAGENLVKTP